MINIEDFSWYIVEEADEGGWEFSQPFGSLGDTKINIGTDSYTRENGIYRHGRLKIAKGSEFIMQGFVMENSTQVDRW